jgi:hypothetical protein
MGTVLMVLFLMKVVAYLPRIPKRKKPAEPSPLAPIGISTIKNSLPIVKGVF